MGPIAAVAWLVLMTGTRGEPAATEPATTEPIATEPADGVGPTEPIATEPEPTEPEPTEPEPPEPTEPEPKPKPAAPVAPPPEHADAKVAKKPDRYAAWEKRYGGFAELDLQLTTIDKAFAMVVGGGAGFILKKRVIVGASGYGVVFHDRRYGSIDGDRQLRMGWGGPTLGVHLARRRRVESTVNWLLAGGRACLNLTASDPRCGESTAVFVSQLDLDVYVKLAKILRLGVGIGYRFVGGASWSGPGNWSIAGGYGSFKLALGRF